VQQEIRFTSGTGARVAWAVAGTGPTLVVGGWWCSHLELDWQDPAFRSFAERLAGTFRVVRYDRPGTGLSDRDVPPPAGLDDEVDVLDAVVRAATAATGESSVLLLGCRRAAASRSGMRRPTTSGSAGWCSTAATGTAATSPPRRPATR
jgi:pimeloyl-ACP methyl ester carboxylesterase